MSEYVLLRSKRSDYVVVVSAEGYADYLQMAKDSPNMDENLYEVITRGEKGDLTVLENLVDKQRQIERGW